MNIQLSLNVHELDAALVDEPDNDMWACDWDESKCPACGRYQDDHNSAMMTRCAQFAL